MKDITKRFPGVVALDNANLEVIKGEVHVLVGENGAGKSTLMKILAGAYIKDSGTIKFNGEQVDIVSPKQAEQMGISIIYQELNLIPALTVAENIYMGRHRMKNSIQIDWVEMHNSAKNILDDLEIAINPNEQVKRLGIAQQQMVEVAKALSINSKIIVMDEPTSALTIPEIEHLFKAIKKLKNNGVSIIYISHRLEEVKEIGDRGTIMRDGKTIARVDIQDTSIDEIIRLMVGRELKEKFPKIKVDVGRERFRVENLCCGKLVQNINFSVNAGEILGIGGLVGAGRTETARAIFGLEKGVTGDIFVDGKECKIKCPRDAIAAGIGFVTEDRKSEGLVLTMDVGNNISLASLSIFEKAGVHVNLSKERKTIEEYIAKLKIRTPSSYQKARNLSGGNQQKVVLAKWLLQNSSVLILDEPTRGIDINAKIEVYNLINNLVSAGKAIILISSELPELIGMCDRIVVMCLGVIRGELSRDEATQERVLQYAVGSDK
ncbi:MAG: sugar ABC transporter ATP-binding protein [Rectinemataceae bacterium]